MLRFLLVGAVLPLACVGTYRPDSDRVGTARPTALAIVLDSASYTLRPDNGSILLTRIGFSFVNPLADTIYIVNCNRQLDMRVERLEDDGEWRPYWQADMMACHSHPIVIEPGERYHDVVPVFGSLPRPNTSPVFDPPPDPLSVYRLAWRKLVLHYTDARPPFGVPVPELPIYSEPFRLRIATSE